MNIATHDVVTVVIPTIPPRGNLLREAVDSVKAQTCEPGLLIVTDTEHQGAAYTRHRGLMQVKTPWVAFLDDDDLLMPQHIEHLLQHALEHEADYAYSWFETLPNGHDPFPSTHFTEPWDSDHPRQTTVTTLVRTKMAQEVGYLPPGEDGTIDGQRAGEDWFFTLGCNTLGKISHLVERTWYWRHWGGNTSGLGSRW